MQYRLRTFAASLKQPRNLARILLLALSSILATYLQQLYADVWLLYPIVVISTFVPEIIAAFTQGDTQQPSIRKIAEARTKLIKFMKDECAAQYKSRRVNLKLVFFELPDQTGLHADSGGMLATYDQHPLPQDITIADIFHHHSSPLLILGAGGLGKSSLLYELADTLAEEARNDSERHIPIIVNLSSWAGKQRPFGEWLVDEIGRRYQVQKYAAYWLAEDALVLLLDGLDEVPEASRAACVAAIGEYAAAHTMPTVICSRTLEYARLEQKLDVRYIVEVQPLTLAQLNAQLGEGVYREFCTWINTDERLIELARTPLMLNVMFDVHKDGGLVSRIGAAQTEDELRAILLTFYIERAYKKVTAEQTYTGGRSAQTALRTYTLADVRGWLAWLARSMRFSSFALEDLQPEWLATPAARRIYTLLDRGVGAIVAGTLCGAVFLFAWLVYALVFQPLIEPGQLAYDTLLYIVVGAGVGGLFGGALGAAQVWREVVRRVLGGVLGGLLGIGMGYVPGGWGGAFLCGAIWLIAGLMCGPPGLGARTVVLAGHLRWSLRKYLVDLPVWLLIGVIAALVALQGFGRVGGIVARYLPDWQAVVLAGLILGAFIGFVVSGRTYQPSSEKELERRNHGIRQSARSALRDGLVVFGGLFVIMTLFTSGPTSGFMTALLVGMTSALAHGGYGTFSHIVLRRLLRAEGSIPEHFEAFLGFASRMTLLNRRGDRYEFAHEFYRDFFKSLPDRPAAQPRALAPLAWPAGMALLIGVVAAISVMRAPPAVLAPLPNDSGLLIVTERVDSSPICLRAGQTVQLEARGAVRVGGFVGVVGPTGTDRGFVGLPLGDDYDTVPDMPHGGLLYRTPGEQRWYVWRPGVTITPRVDGCLAFDVNDVETSNNQGWFAVRAIAATP